MTPPRPGPGSAADWIAHAEGDLALANAGRGHAGVPSALVCFHAQQAAEKAIKAVLIAGSHPFPFTHDIAELLAECRHHDIDVPAEIEAAMELTPYAVESRYPGSLEETNDADAEKALATATRVISWARNIAKSEK